MKGLRTVAFLYMIFLLTTISGNTVVKPPTLASAKENSLKVEQNTGSQEESAEEADPSIVVPDYKPDQSPVKGTEALTPVTIEIPSIHLNAPIQNVGRTKDGSMGVPDEINTVGWYGPGYKPGETGNAVLAGHVDGNSKPGAFYFLKEMKKGDVVIVKGEDGEKLEFQVTGIESYTPEDSPLQRIFGYSSQTNLNLITCTGTFNRKSGHYEERLVVYTELVE
ncbi:class F sortase [Guptibacillus hwajinpoensis]|nr:class F sortase [Alkalihalobacillus macyae]